MAGEDLASLIARLERETGGGGAALPVEQWSPAYCGAANIVIAADGTWSHEGTPFTREALVRLFARVLRRDEDGEFYLVTPSEKIRIEVREAPFLAVRAERHGRGRDQQVVFATNVGDVVALDAGHPLRISVDAETGAPRPYVLVRGRLEARLTRGVFYDLVDWGEAGEDGHGLWSGGVWWRLG